MDTDRPDRAEVLLCRKRPTESAPLPRHRPKTLSLPPLRPTRRVFTLFAAGLAFAAAANAADPQIAAFTDTPDPVPAGGNVTYNARIENSALDDATNVFVRVPVPAGGSFISATAPCALVGSNVDCTLGTIAGNSGDIRNLGFTFRANGPGTTLMTASAALTADNDTNPANNNQSQSTTVAPGANLSLAKFGSVDPVVGGANLVYTLSATNAGPNAGGAVVFTDNLPPATSFVSASAGCANAAGVVTCTIAGAVPVGGVVSVTITVRVNATGGTITNSASVAPAAGGVADPDSTNNSTSLDTGVLPGADVRIAGKSVTVPPSGPAIAGQNVTFQIQPRNSGPATAANAVVSDVLPANWGFVSATGPNWACTNSGQTITCSRPSFPVGASDNISVVATAPNNAAVGPTGTSYTNTATISAATADPDASNNSGSVNISVRPDGAELSIAKSKTPNPVAQGSPLVSTITVTNNGPRVATGPLRVVELLAGETYLSVAGSGWTCSAAAAPTIVCDHPNGAGLAVGASLPALVITSTATASGTLSNTACTGSSVPPGGDPGVTAQPPIEGDPNPGNDCAAAGSNSTTAQPDLGITKTASTPTGGDKVVSTSEASVTWTLVVTNPSPGSDSATGIVIRDTVPAYISGRTTINPVVASVSGPSSASFVCSISGADVACTQTGGSLAPGQTVTVPITVNRPLTAGAFTNTATVSNTAQGDPNPANNSASDDVTIQPIADVEVNGKTVTPNPIRAGEQATYVISYRNNGPSQATTVNVRDTFTFPPGDSGLTVISFTSTKPFSDCRQGIVSGAGPAITAGTVFDPGNTAFNCNAGLMANGENQSITLVVRANFQPGNAARSIPNTASITTSSAESPGGGDNGNNSHSVTLNVNPALVDLLTNKIDFEDPIAFAGNAFINHRVRVTNTGSPSAPSFATGVRIDETMTPPAGKRIRYVCDTTGPSSAVCNAPTLCTAAAGTTSAPGVALIFSCDVPAGTTATGAARGTLAPTASKDIFLRFEVLDTPVANGDIHTNAATAFANEPDAFAGNDSALEPTTLRQRIDLAVAKSASLATVTLRQPFTWTVTVTNNGPGNSLQTDLIDTLPGGVSVTGPITFSTPNGAGTCSLAGSTISCALGPLDNTEVATISIPARVDTFPGGGTVTNTAVVDTDPAKIGGIDPVAGNNGASNVVTVTRSSLSGGVFQDRDRAGANAGTPQLPAAEPRIAGVTLTLSGTDAYGNAVNSSVTSDANGSYTFANLSPSNASGYTVTQAQPAGFVNSPASPPTSGLDAPSLGGSYAAGGMAGNSSYSGVVVGAAQAGLQYNFPEVRRPSLGGFVYVDSNLNGSRDAGIDAAIPAATVRLLDASTLAVVATTSTDANGAYGFTGLDPLIAYTIEEALPSSPANLRNGPVNPGLVNGAACPVATCIVQPNTPVADTDRIATIDLSAGVDGTAFNFGEQQQASVSGLVFVDADRNNALDGSDSGRVGGVTVRLLQGADCASGTTLQTTTSAAGTGAYAFANVLAFQSYLVCQSQPAGYGTGSANGTPNSNVFTITNLTAAGSANNHFGETLAAITGSVYQDHSPAVPANNDNGVRDAGEAGVANVPVTLTGTDAFGVAVSRSTTTDSSGNYSFEGLFPANAAGYTLTEGAIPPASGIFTDGRETAGNAGGSTAVNDAISGVAPAAGAIASGYLFGELPVAPISGTVYLDRDRDGAIDPLPVDGRIAGVTVRLVQGASCAAGTTLQTTSTAADGSYTFSGATAGQAFLICETQPAAYGEGTTTPGAGNSTPAANTIAIAILPAAGSSGNVFGERAGAVAGNVFLDANNDGARAGDAGIAGVVVTLSGTDITGAAVSRTASSDGTGAYRFDDVLAAGPAGYTITEQVAQPIVAGRTTLNGRSTAGSTGGTPSAVGTVPSAISAVPLAAGVDSGEHNFGEILPVSIAGTVFLDLDNNGVQNAPGDTGLGSIALVVTGTDDTGAAVTRNLATAPDGTFSIADLRPGTYTITEPAQPPQTANGRTTAGSAGGTATTVGTTPSAVAGIVLTTPGAASNANLFAEVATTSTIAGRVFLDFDNDGVFEPGDTGLATVTLELTGTDSNGNAVTRTATTDAQGNYTFPNLPAGTYTVTEPVQPPGTVNGITTAGSTGGTASPPQTTPSTIAGIAVGVGQSSNDNRFGEIAAGPDLLVAKTSVETRFTVNNAVSYTLRVRNAGFAPTTGAYRVLDRLPVGTTLAATPTGSGWACVGVAGATSFSCTSSAVLAVGAIHPSPITAVVRIGAAALQASPVINAVLVDGGGEQPSRGPSAAELDAFNNNPANLPACDAAITHNACRTSTPVQAAASISGTAWYDVGGTRGRLDAGDSRLPAWQVEVLDASGAIVARASTLTDGSYRIGDLIPGVELRIRFRDPAANVVFGYPVNGETAPASSGATCNSGSAIANGTASSCPGSGADPALTVVLASGQSLPQQSLPVDPSGVVYDSNNRQPVPGAIVTLAPSGSCPGYDPATSLVAATLGGYTINGSATSMTVGSEGYYQFLFAPGAPASCTFTLAVAPPATYSFVSVLIPPAPGTFVPGGAPGSTVAVQPQATPPTGPVGPATTYHLAIQTGSGGANVIHNHIPLDPAAASGLSLSKTGDRQIIEVGDSIRYTITVQRSSGPVPLQLSIVDRLPAGFTFIAGTATVNGNPLADPGGRPGPALVFNLGAMPSTGQLVLQYRARVGVGSQQGDGTNRAIGYGCGVVAGCTQNGGASPLAGVAVTNEGRHTVRVTGGVFTTEACVLGRVFVDCNGNHVQDAEEIGIPGVRLVISDGTILISDSEGKYSFCGLPPKSHVIRIDETTLPNGSRLTTSSNRNLGDAGSLWLDLKNGELHRADFIEGSCRPGVLDQVKARRAQGEVRSVESEPKQPALRFDSGSKGPKPRAEGGAR